MNDPFKTDLQRVMFYDKYSRWNPTARRRETWWETVDRVMKFFEHQLIDKYGQNPISHDDWDGLLYYFRMAEVLPSMRILQMAGEPLERCNVGGYNCAYIPIESPKDIADLLYILMQGTGVGFSVEQHYVAKWPEVAHWDDKSKLVYEIKDTTEGWADAVLYALEMGLKGYSVDFDYSHIRPAGSRLKTKGGIASGPRPLQNLMKFIDKTLRARSGSLLRSIDLHDIVCYCGQIVQVGGVRRAALISLSSIGDLPMARAKRGKFWERHAQRMMANNSAVYNNRAEFEEHFDREFTELQLNGTGERGIFNRSDLHLQIPERRNPNHLFGLNPCAEIILRPRQFCNLSITVTREHDTEESLQKKLKYATLFGCIQSTLTNFNYISPQWRKNCEEERLLGVDITGQFDNIALFTPESLKSYRETVVENATHYAQVLNINHPTATTCVKPSGNSSQLLDCSSGMHPRYAPYYIRRIRIGASTYMGKFLQKSGVPCHPETGQDPNDPSILVFEFPVKAPEGNPTRQDVSAVDQLGYWLMWKMFYTEHNPSCTVYVKPDEWEKVGEWIKKNFVTIGGLSFLPYDGGTYELAPYEEITKERYEELLSKMPSLDFDAFLRREIRDHTNVTLDYACTSGSCDL